MSSAMEPPALAAAINTHVATKVPLKKLNTLGSVRQRNEFTNEMILIPTPSNDPNDPLNWSQRYKLWMATLICLAMFMCNLVAAGPTIAIVDTAMDFFPDWMTTTPPLVPAISKTAYFFTTTALLQGTGNMIWMPLVNKYGRRPVYLASYIIYLSTCIWAAFTYSYGSFLAARILMGFGAGAAETMAPLSIADVFFLHERGTIMAMYTAALSIGVGGGLVIDGLITINHPWRYIYYVAIALVGTVLILAFLFFPETNYIRQPIGEENEDAYDNNGLEKSATADTVENASPTLPKKKTYVQQLKVFTGTYTDESLFRMFIRPFALILLPPVLWGTLVMSVTIGFVVAVTSNVASAFSTTYGFAAYQTGLCFFACIIGSLLGIPAGGQLGDWCADYLTKRNNGIREPEFRLPAITVSLITAPLSLVLYGVGIQHQLHWICPTIGLGLLNFSITQATNISLVYTIDAYRPIAGEITLASMGFKSAFGFLLSFYTNPWIEEVGYQNAYGTMAGISAAVLVCWIPFYVWGKRIRFATWEWKICHLVRWSDDREVGE